jgi:hypothetical protein
MPQNSETVAHDICKEDYYKIVGTFLECSLCNAGWPMKTGRISVSFYTEPCRLKTGPESYVNESYLYPSPSWFWGFESTEINLGCPPVDEGKEYEPNVWVGRAERSSNPTSSGAAIQLEILARFEQLDETSVKVDLTFNVNRFGYWVHYFSTSTVLVRKDTDLCMPCGRSYASDYISVSPESDVCPGDLRYVRISAGTSPWFEGCGPELESEPGMESTGPICGFFDGNRLFTCFRAMAYSKAYPTPAFKPTFNQIGFTLDGCGGLTTDSGPRCNCLYGIKGPDPKQADTNAYIRTLGLFDMGCPGESNTAFQKVQIGALPGTGFEMVVKDTGSGTLCCALRNTTSGTFQLSNSTTVVNANSPYILKVEFNTIRVYLYAMQFPNPDILPELCYTGTGTTPDCGTEVFSCNGTCVYIYSELFDTWVAQSGTCTSTLGYTCSCVEPPNPAEMSPSPIDGDIYETNCR